MQHAFNAYIGKVLEHMTAGPLSLSEAKSVCLGQMQFLEKSYVSLADVQVVAGQLTSH